MSALSTAVASHPSQQRFVRRTVSNPRYSLCGSAKLADLDWGRWWTDTSFESHYLHVMHKDGETSHRVYCRSHDCPRLEMVLGKLMWLYSPNDQDHRAADRAAQTRKEPHE